MQDLRLHVCKKLAFVINEKSLKRT